MVYRCCCRELPASASCFLQLGSRASSGCCLCLLVTSPDKNVESLESALPDRPAPRRPSSNSKRRCRGCGRRRGCRHHQPMGCAATTEGTGEATATRATNRRRGSIHFSSSWASTAVLCGLDLPHVVAAPYQLSHLLA